MKISKDVGKNLRVILARVVILLTVFLFGFYYGQFYLKKGDQLASDTVNSSLSSLNEKVSLMIDFGNGDLNIFNDLLINSDSTVFSVLKTELEKEKIDLKYKDYGGDLGVMIESINEQANSTVDMKYWQYWVNNKYAKIGASQQPVNENDIIEWKLIKGQFNQ